MNKFIIRGAVAAAAAAALIGLDMSVASVPGADAKAGHPARASSATAVHAAAVPGAQVWVKRYNGPANGDDGADSVAVSPDGTKVFVTGDSTGTTSGADYLTIAHNAVTGAQLWVRRYNGPANGDDFARAVAVSPTGGKVFVTGGSGGDYATVAYNAATGAQVWVKRYNGPFDARDAAYAVAVSPGGRLVFVTGYSEGSGYVTLAYSASTGTKQWIKLYNGGSAYSVAVSPSGGTVFVTGGQSDYNTVAYNAATGAQLWAKRYSGPAGDSAYSVAVSPAGSKVFVTGASEGNPDYLADYATVAYDAATGARLWVQRYNGPARGTDEAYSVAVSHTGREVFVTGWSNGTTTNDYATVAYNADTGVRLWVRRYHGTGDRGSFARSLAVSPTANTAFVTGESYGATSGLDYATIAYSG